MSMNEEKEFNVEEFQQEFENEWQDKETEESVEADESQETVEEQSDESQEELVSDEEGNEEPPIHDEDEHKRNQAFAELRKQAEEGKKYQQFLQTLAEENGVSVEDIIARAEQRRMEAQAEEQGVPVDVLQRLNSLEAENTAAKEAMFAERFNQEVRSTLEKYQAGDQEFQAVVKYAAENNIDIQQANIPFESLYKLAHLDTITERQVNEARQRELADKKKRQSESAIDTGVGGSQAGSEEITDEFVDNYLAQHGIRI